MLFRSHVVPSSPRESLQLPNSLNAERELLGSALVDPQRVWPLLDGLGADAFYVERHQCVVAAMRRAWDTDGTFDLLEPYANHGLVTIVKWPLPGGQLGAYNHALRFFGPSAEWLAYVDVDEFIVPVTDDDIPF